MDRPLVASDSLGSRLRGYMAERFPLLSTGLLVLAFFAGGFFAVAKAPGGMDPVRVTPREMAGAIVLLLVFFHLRLFDEFKDHARDARAHPQRLLSRGVVTLALLRNLCFAVIVLEIVLIAWIAGTPLPLYAAILLYSILMRYEFLVGLWLTRHPVFYTASHTLITPLMALYICAFAEPAAFPGVSGTLFAGVATSGILAFELGRKTWAPEQEHEDADSYSKLWGPSVAALATAVAVVLCAGASVALSTSVGLHWTVSALIVACACVPLLAARRFAMAPTAAGARQLANATSLVLFTSLVAIAVCSALDLNLQWGWMR